MKKKPKFEDDGRTIANMNIDGMPWYTGKNNPAPGDSSKSKNEAEPLSPGETWAITKGVLLASLLVAGVFIAGFSIFILFCVFVWFK